MSSSSFELKVNADSSVELQTKVLSLMGIFQPAATTNAAEEKAEVSKSKKEAPKRTSKKASDASANLITEETSDDPSDMFGDAETENEIDDMFGDEEAEAETPSITLDQVRVALKNYQANFGTDMTKVLLKKFGYERPADIKEKEYQKIFDAASAAAPKAKAKKK